MTEQRRKRLGIIIPSHWEANLGGSEYQVQLLVERLLELDLYEIHYIARRVPDNYRPVGYFIHQIAKGRRFGGSFLPDSLALWRLLKKIQPDIIYQRVGCAYTGVAAFYSRRHNCRLVWHVASESDVGDSRSPNSKSSAILRMDKWVLGYGVRNADAIVIQNKKQGELLSRNYCKSYTKLISNFHPSPVTRRIKKQSPVIVTWIANIKPLKQPEVFVKLARDLHDNEEIKFVMAGAPPRSWRDWESIKRQMDELQNISYIGPQSQSSINDLLEESHILVNTSTHEGFPNTFIQAWMRNVTVISLSANPDGLLDSGELGFCANGQYENLRRLVENVANDQALRATIGIQAERYARERFSEKNIDELIELLAS